jgi:sporulation protein YlmC with PRC-barrel domain
MIRASDLIGAVVRTESGERLGRVHDLRGVSGDDGGWLLLGLVTGRRGMLARFEGAQGEEAVRGGNVIPWEAVTRLEEGVVVVRDVVADAPTP